MAKKSLTDREGEVQELTRGDIAEMKPFKDVFPDLHESWKRGRGRPPKEQPKQRLTLRLDADIVAFSRCFPCLLPQSPSVGWVLTSRSSMIFDNILQI